MYRSLESRRRPCVSQPCLTCIAGERHIGEEIEAAVKDDSKKIKIPRLRTRFFSILAFSKPRVGAWKVTCQNKVGSLDYKHSSIWRNQIILRDGIGGEKHITRNWLMSCEFTVTYTQKNELHTKRI